VAEALTMSRAMSTLALLLVLAGLAGYIYFVDRAPSDPLQDHVFGTLGSDEIEEVEIRVDGEAPTRAQRVGDEWRLIEPIDADGDRTELSVITGAIATLTRQRVIDEEAADLSQYGLEPARIDVGFRVRGDEMLRRILIGDKTPGGGDLYARLPDERRVFLVSAFLESTFNKDAFALRDRTILHFAREAVEGLELASGGTTLRFSRTDDEWRLVEPIAARADYGAVEGAVQRLGSGRMQSIVADEAGDLRPYGLDRPVATMTVLTRNGPATLTLGATENALMFAKDASRPLVFTVAPALQTDVIKPVSDYRRRDLFDARTFSTTRIELRRNGRTLAFERTTSEDEGDTWRDDSGNERPRDEVEQLLTRLTFLRAASFDTAMPAALKTPELAVDIQFDGGRSERVIFARSGDDVVAGRADEPGAARIEAGAYDDMVEALDALDE
jgi:hypothetical protein